MDIQTPMVAPLVIVKMPDTGNLRREGFIVGHSLRALERAWQQEPKAAGHSGSTQEAEMNTGVQLTVNFFGSQGPSHGMATPCLESSYLI